METKETKATKEVKSKPNKPEGVKIFELTFSKAEKTPIHISGVVNTVLESGRLMNLVQFENVKTGRLHVSMAIDLSFEHEIECFVMRETCLKKMQERTTEILKTRVYRYQNMSSSATSNFITKLLFVKK